MIKRWLIRSFFIFLLVLFAAGWVHSLRYNAFVSYATDTRYGDSYWGHYDLYWSGFSSEGALGILWGRDNNGDAFPGGAQGLQVSFFEDRYSFHAGSRGMEFAGFSYARDIRDSHDTFRQTYIAVPHWFLVTASCGMLLLAWRKTRPKPDPSTAFPVEAAAKDPTA